MATPHGQLTSVAYPSGLKVFYQRDKGRITGIDVQEPAASQATVAPLRQRPHPHRPGPAQKLELAQRRQGRAAASTPTAA